jgi:phage terminase large subunit-like protein
MTEVRMPDFLGSSHYPLASERAMRRVIDMQPPEKRAGIIDMFREAVEAQPAIGYRPLPQARRFHDSTARIRINVGGNRSSKSFSLIQETYWRLTNTHPNPRVSKQPKGINAWYATKSYELVGMTFWPAMKILLQGWAYNVDWIKREADQPRAVRIKIGDNAYSKISFKAYEQGRETFQAAGLDLVALDEQPPQDIWIEILTRIGAGRRLSIIAGFTPIIPQPWMEEIVTNPRPGTEVFNYPLDDNRISRGGFLDDAEVDGMIAEWPDEVVETRRNGKWGSFVGTIFQSFSRDTHVVKETDEGKYLFHNGRSHTCLPPTWCATGAIDWGGSHPMVFLWGVRLPHMDDAWYIFDEYFHAPLKQGQRLLEEHADEIKRRTEERWQTSLVRVWADHDSTNANEFSNYGIPSTPADKGPNSVLASIEYIQTLLKVRKDTGKPRLFIAERCKNLIEGIRNYRWQPGTDKKDAKEAPVKLNDDCVDALRYLCHSERDYAEAAPRRVLITNPANKRMF